MREVDRKDMNPASSRKIIVWNSQMVGSIFCQRGIIPRVHPALVDVLAEASTVGRDIFKGEPCSTLNGLESHRALKPG